MNVIVSVLVVLLSSLFFHMARAQSSNASNLFENECQEGTRADDYPSWIHIAGNAQRTADEYAVKHNPQAVYVGSSVEPLFQIGGGHAGQYLVKLLHSLPGAVSFAMLRPNFSFCSDPSLLDDTRADLFSVVQAKFNGRPF